MAYGKPGRPFGKKDRPLEERLKEKMKEVRRGRPGKQWIDDKGQRREHLAPRGRMPRKPPKPKAPAPVNFGADADYKTVRPPGRPPLKTHIPRHVRALERQHKHRQTEREVDAMVEKANHLAIAKAIENLPRDLTTGQVAMIAQGIDEVVQNEIRAARKKLRMNASRYVEAHMTAVEGALVDKNYDAAMKGAQWAMDVIQEGDAKIVDPEQKAESHTPKVVVGIQLGGTPTAADVITAASYPVLEKP